MKSKLYRFACLTILGLGLAQYVLAGRIMFAILGPSNNTANVTIAAAGTSIKNCLTDVDVYSDAAFTFRILDGGTTVYAVVASSGSTLIRSWNDFDALCGTANTAMYLNVSAGNSEINYVGFTGQ